MSSSFVIHNIKFQKETVTGLITLHLFSTPHRVSNDCIDHVYHSVMSQLNQEHAEIRLSAFQIAGELFSRSHHFRMLLVDNFQVNQLLVTSNHLRSSSAHQTLQDLAFYWQNKANDGILWQSPHCYKSHHISFGNIPNPNILVV